MKIKIDIPDYDGNAMDVIWEKNANYVVNVNEEEVIISANKQALISFARQMLYMAHNDLPIGSHVHYDEFFTKSITKKELIIEKVE